MDSPDEDRRPPGRARGERRRAVPDHRRALVVCLAGAFVALLNMTVIYVALPAVRHALGASDSAVQWIVSGYALAFGLTLVAAGRIGDAAGYRLMFMVGTAVFTAASVLCGVAQNALWLTVARFVQGFGSGMTMPQVSALIQRLFHGAERDRAFGALATAIGFAIGIGPVLGGLVVQVVGPEQGWRWIFYGNVPIGVAVFILAARRLPADAVRRRLRVHDLDPVGVVLLGVGITALLLPLVEAQEWHGDGKWLLVAAGGAVLAIFVAWESWYARSHPPLVDLALFRRRSYACGALVMFLYFAGFTSILFVFALYLQTGLGESALTAGLMVTPFALGTASSAPLAGRLVIAHGPRVLIAGLLVVIGGVAGCVVLIQHDAPESGAWVLLGPLLAAGFGNGLVIAPNQALSLAEVPDAEAGSAGGVLQTAQRVGQAVGVAAAGSALFSGLASNNGSDWDGPVRHALWVVIGFVALALAFAIWDALDRPRAPSAPVSLTR